PIYPKIATVAGRRAATQKGPPPRWEQAPCISALFGGALDERAGGVRDAFLQVLDGLGNAILHRVDRALGIAGGQRFDGGGAAFLHIGGGVLNAFLQRFGGGGGLYLSSRFL